jgi:acetyl-CoA acetyltransferase
MPKAETAFSRSNAVHDTTIGWRFVNKLMKEQYGVDAMPETAENVATDYRIEREAQDRMALASQLKAVAAQQSGYFDAEITPVTIAQKKGDPSSSPGRASARDVARGARQAEGRRAARRHRHRRQRVGSSTTVRARCCWPARAAATKTGSRRVPVSSAWPRPGCRRASWAWARRRPRARCWR